MKTVFFAFSALPVFRNLLFFPGSVCDRMDDLLKRDPEFRVVFLIPETHRAKYGDYLAPRLSDRFIAEYVTVAPARGFVQKAFYFFYSYLLYTGTTYVVATMGLRPDEPPAGGRWYLAPLKRGIAATFGRSAAVRYRLVPRLYRGVFRERPFAELFERYRPRLVFAPHVYGQFDTRLLSEAKLRGVRTMGMAAGWDHLDKYFLPFRVDRLLAQSTYIRDMAMAYQGYRPDAITLVGYPHLDFIVNPKYQMSRSDLLANLRLPPDAKIIMYVSGSAYCPDEPEVIERMIGWMDEGRLPQNLYIVIRPYLGGRSADREFDKKKFARFEEHPRVRFWKREAWEDLEKTMFYISIMRHADIVLSIFTTAMLEASVFGAPLVTTLFDGTKKRPLYRSVRRLARFSHFKIVLASGALKLTHDFGELFRALKEYLDDPAKDADKRARLRDRILWRLDGRASERIMEKIREALSASHSL